MSKNATSKLAYLTGQGLGVVLVIIILGSIIAMVGAPLYFLFRWISSANKISKEKDSPVTKNSIWLNASEVKRFKGLSVVLYQAKKEKLEAISFAESKPIPKNQDGSYSRRSADGKKVTDIINNANGVIDDAERELNEIAETPAQRWNSVALPYKQYAAAKAGLIAFGIIFVVSLPFFSDSNFMVELCWIIAGYGSLMVYCIRYALAEPPFALTVPKPPEVDMKNIELWPESIP